MKWLDSNPVKIINLLGSIFTILGSIAGFVYGKEQGASLAYSLGYTVLAGTAVSLLYLGMYGVWLHYIRPNCRHCQGTGRFPPNGWPYTACEICSGKGKERLSP